MERDTKSISLFKNGYNCAQSVALSFTDIIGIEERKIAKITTGFGAGMGRLQNTCGAVSGAYFVLGSVFGNPNPDTREITDHCYEMIREFTKEFEKIYHTTECEDLLGCSFATEKGREEFAMKKLKENVCTPCVADAVRIVEELIAEKLN